MAAAFDFLTFLVVAMLINCSQQQSCAVLHFYNLDTNVTAVFEDQFVKVIFGMNVSTTCETTNQSYKITVSTRTSSGSLEYDGTIIFWKDKCTDALLTSVRCITPAGPAELYRKVNRSHVAIEWQWSLKDSQTGQFRTVQKDLKLNISYPPRVTSFTVNGHEISGNHLVSEGQEVNISCSFDKGSPPQNVFLVDKNGSRLNAINHQQRLNYLLTLQCKDDWPTILCAGSNSQNNKSVSFIVKCPPQFISKSPSVVDSAAFDSWIFSIKAHTKEIHKCFLTSAMFGENSNTAENCILTGDPPRLLLLIDVDKKKSSKGGNWALILQNEIGSSDMLYFNMPSADIMPSSDNKNSNGSTFSLNIIIIGGGAGGGLVIIIIIIVVVVKCRKSGDVNIQNIAGIVAEKQAARKSDSSAGTGAGAAGNDSKSGGSSARSSSSGSDKPSSNPNYTSTALQEVEIHAYMDLHTRDPTYAATASKKDNHTYIELRTKRMQSEPPQPPAEGSRNSAIYANQERSPKAPVLEEEDEDEDEANYYNTAS